MTANLEQLAEAEWSERYSLPVNGHTIELPPLDAYVEDDASANDAEPRESTTAAAPALIQRVASMDWSALAGQTPPSRDWAIDHWLPMQTVTLAAGQAGIGKTLLLQAMSTALSLGYDYVGPVQRARRVLFWAGEDPADELWRRQLAICAAFSIPLTSLPDAFQLKSYATHDITLAGLGYGHLARTSMMTELRDQVADYSADVVVLDSVARVYGGSEIDRHQVTTFIAWLAEACPGAAVVLIGHPGKATGAEFSGSTAWEASVRTRLYFGTRLPGDQGVDDDAGEPDDATRYLCRRKANYSAKDWVRLLYRDGVFEPQIQEAAPAGPGSRMAVDVVLQAVRKLRDIGLHGNASSRSPEYLPRLAREYQFLQGLTERQFAAGMRELMKGKRLIHREVGRYSNRTPKMALAEASSP